MIMTPKPFRKFLRDLHHTAGADTTRLTDGQLLDQFVSGSNPVAFEALLHRHGPLIWGACRRLLSEPQDVEDAFQATFLVVLRKAKYFQRRSSLGTWLYGIAYRVALKARQRDARRGNNERRFAEMTPTESACEAGWEELKPVLDAELDKLPEKYRAPLVLCYLEGKTNEQAASELGRPAGSISKHLARGRELLRERLQTRGVALTAAALGSVLTQNAATAVPPAPVVDLTATVASGVTAVKGTTAGVASLPVSDLTEGVLRTMFLSKLKTFALGAAVLLAGALCSTVLVAQLQPAAPPPVASAAPARPPEAAPDRLGLTPETLPKLHALVGPQANEWRHLRVNWYTDIVAARKKAAAQDKPLIFVYTGGAGYNDPLGVC
jgi:RNA polymerase sigma factor (sigma-70 family)